MPPSWVVEMVRRSKTKGRTSESKVFNVDN
jgi:GTP-binding protein EngB required for normal cell division